jgi:hypothetical protein
MEITIMMVWGLFVTVFSVVVGVILTRSLANKDVLIKEKTLKLYLAPIDIKLEHILEKCVSANNRILNLEVRRENNVVDPGRIQRK